MKHHVHILWTISGINFIIKRRTSFKEVMIRYVGVLIQFLINHYVESGGIQMNWNGYSMTHLFFTTTVQKKLIEIDDDFEERPTENEESPNLNSKKRKTRVDGVIKGITLATNILGEKLEKAANSMNQAIIGETEVQKKASMQKTARAPKAATAPRTAHQLNRGPRSKLRSKTNSTSQQQERQNMHKHLKTTTPSTSISAKSSTTPKQLEFQQKGQELHNSTRVKASK
ncbi:hypothetical protein LXL04_024564 [Taraxacum kok-saghyz]